MTEITLDRSTAVDRDATFGALVERDRSLAVADLARDVARRERAAGEERGGDGDGPPSRPGPRTVATQLHHWHLPKLVAAGLVERDAERGTVELAADLPPLADLGLA